jgi:glycosyltransferase involved in cell wall biosynthesis
MKFSIITACYNSSKTIGECLTSVNNQTYPDIEHIIIDGGSSDNSLDKLNSVPNRITKIISEPDRGIYDALNKGILNSTGDIIGILHSDDKLASETVIEQVSTAFSRTSAGIVYGDLEYVDRNDIQKVIRNWKSKQFDKKFVNKGWMPPHPTMFIKREIFMKHGLYDIQYRIASDYDLIMRLMQINEIKFVYLNAVITKMRMGGASNRSLRNVFLKSSEDFNIIKKNRLRFPFIVLARKNISKLSQFF